MSLRVVAVPPMKGLFLLLVCGRFGCLLMRFPCLFVCEQAAGEQTVFKEIVCKACGLEKHERFRTPWQFFRNLGPGLG